MSNYADLSKNFVSCYDAKGNLHRFPVDPAVENYVKKLEKAISNGNRKGLEKYEFKFKVTEDVVE